MLGQHVESMTLNLGAEAVEVDVFDHLLASVSLVLVEIYNII